MNMAEDLEDFCDEVIKWSQDSIRKLPKFKKEVKAKVKELKSKHSKEMAQAYGVVQAEKYKDAFNKAVFAFYDDYDPYIYVREGDPQKESGGLYDLYQPTFDDDGLIIGTTSDGGPNPMDLISNVGKMPDFIYELTFLEGWHGGAKTINDPTPRDYPASVWGAHPAKGRPVWRTWGWVTYPDGETKVHRYGSWKIDTFPGHLKPTPQRRYEKAVQKAEIELKELKKKLHTEHAKQIKTERRAIKQTLFNAYFWPSWLEHLM